MQLIFLKLQKETTANHWTEAAASQTVDKVFAFLRRALGGLYPTVDVKRGVWLSGSQQGSDATIVSRKMAFKPEAQSRRTRAEAAAKRVLSDPV